MSAEENLALVKELLEAMRAHDIPKGTSYYAEDSILDMIPVRDVIRGPEGLAAAWGMAWTAFPDQTYEEENIFAYGDYVCFEGVMAGTQKGTYLGLAPTGKYISMRVAFIWRIEDGKVKEWHSYWDAADVLRKMGIIPQNTSLPFEE